MYVWALFYTRCLKSLIILFFPISDCGGLILRLNKLFNMTSSMLRRQLKNLVQNYSEAEVKVRWRITMEMKDILEKKYQNRNEFLAATTNLKISVIINSQCCAFFSR